VARIRLVTNDKVSEQLSTLLDGETDLQTQDRLVSEMLRDEERLDRFGRYRLIGDVMRGESAVIADGMHRRVAGALEVEPTVLAPARRAPRWVRPAAGVALAASVAAAAIMVAPQFANDPVAPGPAVVQAPPPVPAAIVPVSAGPETVAAVDPVPGEGRWQALDDSLEQRLNRLVIEHHEFGGRTGINGPVAHVGLVNYAGR
jgi:sigma-E factor negative regulatory protein RseA